MAHVKKILAQAKMVSIQDQRLVVFSRASVKWIMVESSKLNQMINYKMADNIKNIRQRRKRPSEMTAKVPLEKSVKGSAKIKKHD